MSILPVARLFLGQYALEDELTTAPQKGSAEWDRIERHFWAGAKKIVNASRQPKEPRGVLFILTQSGMKYTAMTVHLALALKKAGWAVVYLDTPRLKNDLSGIPALDQFESCFYQWQPHTWIIDKKRFNRDLNHEWRVEWQDRRVEAHGINFHACFDERLGRLLRCYTVDVEDNGRKLFAQYIKAADKALTICCEIFDTVVKCGIPVRIIGAEPGYVPTGVFATFTRDLGHNFNMDFIYLSEGYENYTRAGRPGAITTIAGARISRPGDRRSPLSPSRRMFEDWIAKRRPTAEETSDCVGRLLAQRRGSGTDDPLKAWMRQCLRDRLANHRAAGGSVICVFGKVPYDRGLWEDNGVLHADMKDWVNDTIGAVENESILILLRPHPSEGVAEYFGIPNQCFVDLIEKRSNRVLYLDPQSIELRDVAEHIDAGVLWFGTSGVELTALGIPAIYCSKWTLQDYPLPLYVPASKQEYHRWLNNPRELHVTDTSRMECAEYLLYMSEGQPAIPYDVATLTEKQSVGGPPKWRRHAFHFGDPRTQGISTYLSAIVTEHAEAAGLESAKALLDVPARLGMTPWKESHVHSESVWSHGLEAFARNWKSLTTRTQQAGRFAERPTKGKRIARPKGKRIARRLRRFAQHPTKPAKRVTRWLAHVALHPGKVVNRLTQPLDLFARRLRSLPKGEASITIAEVETLLALPNDDSIAPDVIWRLGKGHSRWGHREAAARCFEWVLERQPENFYRALAYIRAASNGLQAERVWPRLARFFEDENTACDLIKFLARGFSKTEGDRQIFYQQLLGNAVATALARFEARSTVTTFIVKLIASYQENLLPDSQERFLECFGSSQDQLWETLLAYDSISPDVIWGVGKTHSQRGNTEAAVKCFELVLERQPENLDRAFAYVKFYVKTGFKGLQAERIWPRLARFIDDENTACALIQFLAGVFFKTEDDRQIVCQQLLRNAVTAALARFEAGSAVSAFIMQLFAGYQEKFLRAQTSLDTRERFLECFRSNGDCLWPIVYDAKCNGNLSEAADEANGIKSLTPLMMFETAEIYERLGRDQEAIELYERGEKALGDDVLLKEYPRFLGATYAARLRLGDFHGGWRELSKRRDRYRFAPPPGVQMWNGQPVANDTLVVLAEGGIGDELSGASYYSDLLGQAAKVIVTADPRLVPLFQRSFPELQFFGTKRHEVKDWNLMATRRIAEEGLPLGRPMPASVYCLAQFLDHITLAHDLPLFFRQTRSAFPEHSGYLLPDPERCAQIRKALDDLGPGPKVGISWRSGSRTVRRAQHYSDLSEWKPILSIPGVRFVNLQYDDCQEEIAKVGAALGIKIHEMKDLDLRDDLEGFAALVKVLDCVIAPNNMVKEMAGAVGTRTLFMASSRAAWANWRRDPDSGRDVIHPTMTHITAATDSVQDVILMTANTLEAIAINPV